MAYELGLQTITRPAAADLSASQYCAVDADSTTGGSQVNLPSSHGRAIGVLQNAPKSGNAADVAIHGITKMVCAGAVTAGFNISVDAAGKAVNAATGYIIIGVALETGAASRIISVLLMQQGVSA